MCCLTAITSISVALPSDVFAQPAATLKDVARFVNGYIRKNACEFALVNPSKVFTYTIKEAGQSVQRFVAIWHGDERCTNGSGQNLLHLSIVEKRGSAPLKFLNTGTSTVQGLLQIDKVISASHQEIVVNAIYIDSEQCCEQERVRAILRRAETGFFNMVDFDELPARE